MLDTLQHRDDRKLSGCFMRGVIGKVLVRELCAKMTAVSKVTSCFLTAIIPESPPPASSNLASSVSPLPAVAVRMGGRLAFDMMRKPHGTPPSILFRSQGILKHLIWLTIKSCVGARPTIRHCGQPLRDFVQHLGLKGRKASSTKNGTSATLEIS